MPQLLASDTQPRTTGQSTNLPSLTQHSALPIITRDKTAPLSAIACQPLTDPAYLPPRSDMHSRETPPDLLLHTPLRHTLLTTLQPTDQASKRHASALLSDLPPSSRPAYKSALAIAIRSTLAKLHTFCHPSQPHPPRALLLA